MIAAVQKEVLSERGLDTFVQVVVYRDGTRAREEKQVLDWTVRGLGRSYIEEYGELG